MKKQKRQASVLKDSQLDKTAKMLDLPYEIMPGSFTVEIYENKKITFCGRCEIVRYATDMVALKSKAYLVTVRGENLELESLSNCQICLKGVIGSLEYSLLC